MDLAFRMLLLLALSGAATWTSFALRRYFLNAEIPQRFDRNDVDLAHRGPMLVQFTSPYCYECQVGYPLLQAASETYNAPLAVIDAKQRPDLAVKYAIRTTPTILVVDGKGKVTTGWLDATPSHEDLDRALVSASR